MRVFNCILPLILALAGWNANAQSERPNILLLIADDWSYPHASFLGDNTVKTPQIDRVAREGISFSNAFVTAPSCTASRASILTGRYPHQLEEGANLYGPLSVKFPNYVSILASEGYFTGLSGKGWGPGNFVDGGYVNNPAGKSFTDFREFISQKPKDKPFCFWFGSSNPHRPYNASSRKGPSSQIKVPPFWPSNDSVKSDILDYYMEVEAFDSQIDQVLSILEAEGLSENTIVIITSDNGMPFPRAKANLYEYGVHVPLVIRWPKAIKQPEQISDYVSLVDLMPTILEACDIKQPSGLAGKSLLPYIKSNSSGNREIVFFERERHANVRAGNLSYPSRGLRTSKFLYIRNLQTDRWPAGDPEFWFSVGPYGDVDEGLTKSYILNHQDECNNICYYSLSFGKRPAEELYDLKNDPYQLKNLATDSKFQSEKGKLSLLLNEWMKVTDDPRLKSTHDLYSDYKYHGPSNKK